MAIARDLIESEVTEFIALVYPTATPHQMVEVRRTFLAGMLVCLNMGKEITAEPLRDAVQEMLGEFYEMAMKDIAEIEGRKSN